MPSLTVWRYDTPFGADAGALRLKNLEQQHALTVHDAVTVAWLAQEKEPRIAPVHHATGAAAGKGSLLGGLIGLVLLAPAVGAAAGATIGAVSQKLSGTGVDGALLTQVKEALEPGSSALVVLSSGADLDAIRPFLDRQDSVLIHAELSDEAPERLRAALRERGSPTIEPS